MRCAQCQQENPQGAKFCNACGVRLEVVCPACAHPNLPGSRFCNECGQPLGGVAPAAPAPPGAAAPSTYTPKHLAERILTARTSLSGERKQVTVLFADLKGSMELLADRDPEEARAFLDPVLERMMEAVHRYEGTVNQVLGDGIMALFGAPLAHEDHAVRACYAALHMREALRRHTQDLRRTHGLEVQVRIGLNSGEVVVRAIGNDLHMDYTAVGQTTHLAARMEQLATPGTIRLTAHTLRLAEGFIQVTPLGPIPVKGLAEPVEVFELLGAAPTRTRFQATAARGLTRFVGRDAEMDTVHRALEQAQTGHGQVVALVGEPGVGKSRLVWEFTHSHRTRDWLVLEGGSVSYGKATPYLPVLDLLKGYCRIGAHDDLRAIREKVTGKVLTLDEALRPALVPLLDVPGEDPKWAALDPPQRRQRTLDALKRLLLRESQVQPLCCVFEDLHWLDSETQALLDGLVESLPAARLLLLVNYRPEYQHGWGTKTYYTQLRLDPLSSASAEELLAALLGHVPELQPLKQLLIERTGGNPFFLEESVRTLVEAGALAGERGAYHVAQPVATLQVPASVQGVLAARIDRLATEDKQLLQTAAVVGKDVSYPLLQAVADLSEDALRGGLAHLQAGEFLYEAQLFPDLAYTFKHALTHEVAYGGLLQERRRTLHARLVEAMEERYGDRLAEQVEHLGHHASRGEVWGKAVAYLRQAGVKALARWANHESAIYFEQALDALHHLPETAKALEQAIDLRFDLRNSLWPLGEFEKIFGYLREAESLATKLNDRKRLAWVWGHMSGHFSVTGHSTEARTFGKNALALAETRADLPLQAHVNEYLGLACLTSGDYQGAKDHFRRIVQMLKIDRSLDGLYVSGFPVASSHAWLAWSHAERGEFEEGMAHGKEGVRIAETYGRPHSLIIACWNLAYLQIIKGEIGNAVRLLERAIALFREYSLTLWSPTLTAALGFVWARSGRVPDGLSLLQEARDAIKSIGVGAWHSLILVQCGEGYAIADRLEDALEFAGRALTLSRERGQRGYEGYALRLLGEISSHPDPPDAETAVGYFLQSMTLADELSMRPLQAHCHLGLGTLYRKIGRLDNARAELTTAIEMFRSMEMNFWLPSAEAELAQAI